MMRGGKTGMSKRKTPYFIIDQDRLKKNLERIGKLERDTNVKILHTLKSFNHPKIIPLIASRLSGFSTSSINEVEMAIQAKAKEIHLYAPAFKKEELKDLLPKISTLSLNSLSQWDQFKHLEGSLGLRINPKLHLPIPSYCNPNLSYSRLGVDPQQFIDRFLNSDDFKNLKGLHFHALFQSSVEGLSILLDHITDHYREVLPQLRWINLGGGHNFTDREYDTRRFVELVQNFRQHYPDIQLYFEPGESVVKNTGEFVTTVVDIVDNIVILDTSIETHLLDVAIVNRRLKVRGTQSNSTHYYYELAGNSCLQGDIIGEYFFRDPLSIGDKIIFEDMIGYSMVKMTEFNGMPKAPLY